MCAVRLLMPAKPGNRRPKLLMLSIDSLFSFSSNFFFISYFCSRSDSSASNASFICISINKMTYSSLGDTCNVDEEEMS